MNNQNSTGDWLKHNWFKLGILACMLILAFAAYQSFVVIPREKEEAKKEAVLAEQTKLEAEAMTKQFELDSCLRTARENYDSNWTGSCKTLGRMSASCVKLTDDKNGYSNYLKEKGLETSIEVFEEYLVARQDCFCSLPSVTADRWDEVFGDEKDACYIRYK